MANLDFDFDDNIFSFRRICHHWQRRTNITFYNYFNQLSICPPPVSIWIFCNQHRKFLCGLVIGKPIGFLICKTIGNLPPPKVLSTVWLWCNSMDSSWRHPCISALNYSSNIRISTLQNSPFLQQGANFKWSRNNHDWVWAQIMILRAPHFWTCGIFLLSEYCTIVFCFAIRFFHIGSINLQSLEEAWAG